jgi:putative FmdB family regulatory protein
MLIFQSDATARCYFFNFFLRRISIMPIYEYECTQCGKIEEAIQKFSDPPLTTCGQCAGTLHKLISQSAFHLKGTGWYVTDYANKSGSSPNSASAAKKEEKTDSGAEKPSSSSDSAAT